MEGEHARSLQRAANLAHHLFIGQRIGQLARVVHRDLRRHPHHHALRASNKHSGRKHKSQRTGYDGARNRVHNGHASEVAGDADQRHDARVAVDAVVPSVGQQRRAPNATTQRRRAPIQHL